jgi:hypothetical protein
VREIAVKFQEMPMVQHTPDVPSARPMTYEDLADWLNDTVRHLRHSATSLPKSIWGYRTVTT